MRNKDKHGNEISNLWIPVKVRDEDTIVQYKFSTPHSSYSVIGYHKPQHHKPGHWQIAFHVDGHRPGLLANALSIGGDVAHFNKIMALIYDLVLVCLEDRAPEAFMGVISIPSGENEKLGKIKQEAYWRFATRECEKRGYPAETMYRVGDDIYCDARISHPELFEN